MLMQRSSLLLGKSIGGWLELRKGYHTYLSPAGELVIVRDNVLRHSLQVMNPATTKNQLQQRRGGQTKSRKSGRSRRHEVDLVASPAVQDNSDELLSVAGLMEEEPDSKSGVFDIANMVSNIASMEITAVDSEAQETSVVSSEFRVMLGFRRDSEDSTCADWAARFNYNSAALLTFSTSHFTAYSSSNQDYKANQILIGPWIISASVVISSSPSPSAAIDPFPLSSPEDLLPGSFQYTLEIPFHKDSEESELGILWTLIDSGEIDGDKYAQVKRRFRSVDQRLREGLPIFILRSGPGPEVTPDGTSEREVIMLVATFCYSHCLFHNS